MSQRTIANVPEDVARGIRQLEPLPVTAQRLLGLINHQDVSLAEVAELIEFDQAIAAAVLRAASTMRYASFAAPSVRDAVLRLGAVALLDLVMEGYLRKLRGGAPAYDLSEQDLWLHGAAAQLAVRALVNERRRAAIPPLAETAALLHDLGKLIISRHLKVDVREILEQARTRGIAFVEAERDVLGTDHAAIGAAVAQAWRFPVEVIDAIERHHSPPFEPSTTLLDAVALANVIAKTIETGLGAEGFNFVVDAGCYRRLGIDFGAFSRACLQAQTWLQDLLRTHRVVA
jgi:putative nucleotidyltransferase with HDIG domain